MSALGIDYGRLEEAKRRLERAGVLVDTITAAARELDDLVDDPDDPVAYALDVAGSMNGNGASPPDAPAELEAGAGHPPRPAPASSSTLNGAGVGLPPESGQTQPGPAPAPNRNPPGATTDAVLKWLEAHPGEWHRVGTIARAVGLSTGSVKSALYGLRSTETVEHNGEPTTRSRWRLDPGLAAELEVPNPIDPGADDVAGDEQDDGGGGDQPDPIGRADVKRDLERVAGLAPPRRSAPPRPTVPRSIAAASMGPQGPARDELKDRIRRRLLEEASTISELAEELEVERTELAPVVIELEATDDDVVKVPGAVRGRGETIYSNVA